MTKQFEWREGQAVNIVSDFNGNDSFIISGNVERLTPTRVVVRTAHGDTNIFRRKDSRQVGYSWPILTNAIRPKN